ncbi:MAG TPA: hypothetical protein VHA10_24200 [Hypericibacter adhaerens]|jgi:hypothetical protein|uniref:Uncharacterized protein n=1 Tax=Hypericibacter adhaerens TaxID=2602016 RepID=A0A5J6MWW9_9PROT|nr:hypothetical protein [Hypericibacter adhaerens]QEX21999.1 hypothetical protein FRZ61_19280 [Hypericibacter adhaerens]HWA46342.1 hypothetical protein [Hypericibacter adhaerens]
MSRKWAWLLGAAFLSVAAMPAGADELKAKSLDTLTQMAAWATPLNDEQMGEMRGGFAGLAFNVIMSGTIEHLADPGTGANGVAGAPDPTVTQSDGMVNIQTAIGNFNGAQGVFQLANLDHSNFNVINQNMFVQIAIIDVANAASIPTIQTLLNGAFHN